MMSYWRRGAVDRCVRPVIWRDADRSPPRRSARASCPPSRSSGEDPYKLQQQIARYGASAAEMPPIWAHACTDGSLLIINGVTPAARIAKLAPGVTVPVEVIGHL